MRRFSHWEYVDRPGFWGWYREWYAVYVEERDVFHFTINVVAHVPDAAREEREIVQIQRDTRRMTAKRERLEAEAALLDSYIKVARKQAEFEPVLVLPHEDPPKQIPYKPQVRFDKVR